MQCLARSLQCFMVVWLLVVRAWLLCMLHVFQFVHRFPFGGNGSGDPGGNCSGHRQRHQPACRIDSILFDTAFARPPAPPPSTTTHRSQLYGTCALALSILSMVHTRCGCSTVWAVLWLIPRVGLARVMRGWDVRAVDRLEPCSTRPAWSCACRRPYVFV